MALCRVLAVALAWFVMQSTGLCAQGFGETETRGPRPDKSQTVQIQIGMTITAGIGPCQGIVATAPVPTEWPEQTVDEVRREISPNVRSVTYRNISSIRQLAASVPVLAAGDDCGVLVTYELKRFSLLPPTDTKIFVMPNTKKLKVEIRQFLAPSPNIECTHTKVKSTARDLAKEKSTAWEKVEVLYDWTRDKVKFESGPLKNVLTTLKDGTGDSEEMSSVFVALCRAIEVPARLVFLSNPGHCYAEFYLEDDEGKGYWFPCRPAGNREFGGLDEFRPIIQKGDSFLIPERPREKLRFVNEHLTGAGGAPQVKFVRELVQPN